MLESSSKGLGIDGHHTKGLTGQGQYEYGRKNRFHICISITEYIFQSKYIFFQFQICGAAVLGVGIWILVDDDAKDYIDIINNANDNPVLDVAIYTMIGIGTFIFLVGFLGFAGACCEVNWMLMVVSTLPMKCFVL